MTALTHPTPAVRISTGLVLAWCDDSPERALQLLAGLDCEQLRAVAVSMLALLSTQQDAASERDALEAVVMDVVLFTCGRLTGCGVAYGDPVEHNRRRDQIRGWFAKAALALADPDPFHNGRAPTGVG